MENFKATVVINKELCEALKLDTIKLYRVAEDFKPSGGLVLLNLAHGQVGFECRTVEAFKKAMSYFQGILP